MKSRASFEPAYVPCSTYRLQLNLSCTFVQASSIVPYLHDLGITDCYTSPFLMARPGSQHGYDVTDHTRFNPEIGSEQEFAGFADQLKKRGMGLVIDVVPNHMCITHPSNLWWWDVLENGPSSDYSRYFDIDWNPPKQELANKVLLPFLPDQFGLVLESQLVRVVYDAGIFCLDSQGTHFPLAAHSWIPLLRSVLARVKEQLSSDDGYVLELESILTALSYLPSREETDAAKIRERQREKEIIRRRLVSLLEASEVTKAAVQEVLTRINGSKGDPHSFDQLERLLDDQAYRLSFWRVASDEINYRRFFDINDLAAIRVENPEVFATVHRIPFALIQKGLVAGIRIDHPDGLFDPLKYFQDLQSQAPLPGGERANGSGNGARRRFYLAAEKILVGNEELRPSWAIEGTTGYGFLNLLNGLFVDGVKKRVFQRLYRKFTGWSQSYSDLIYESKRLVMQVSMSSELNVLSRRLDRISEQHRRSRDFTLESLRDALREVIACFPVYRTYVRMETQHPDEQDERYIRSAIRTAKRRNPATSASVFDFIQDLLLLKDPDSIGEGDRAERRLFVMRFQQLTGPVMAKGLEDTAFYRYCPLLSLNEVGGSPDTFGISLGTFHGRNAARRASWRNAMLASSTHDTKRSEDVRARINVLSEIPAEWYRAIRVWQRLNQDRKVLVAGEPAPSANEDYFLYQTLLGAWPLKPMNAEEYSEFVTRVHIYMEKALREAKVHTSWINPDTEYETAFHSFLDSILDRSSGKTFLEAFAPLQAKVARAGIFNSLSQTLLKIASPGLPDFYQGTEIWNFSLADPDNRRPVNYGHLQSLLGQLREAESENPAALVDQLASDPSDGRLKMYVTRCALQFRRKHRALLARGSYLPLRAGGARHKHVIAFARSFEGRTAIVLTGRFFAQLGDPARLPVGEEIWGNNEVVLRRVLPSGPYRDIFSGQTVTPIHRNGLAVLPLSAAFAHLPIALLVNIEGSTDAR
ncbi:MAG TPA: malto-oligosyltrehalose synthase [Terriglobales bacterium]|nr:malto-oligosyltrehalose synthase [Terriglobales bacterium]